MSTGDPETLGRTGFSLSPIQIVKAEMKRVASACRSLIFSPRCIVQGILEIPLGIENRGRFARLYVHMY